MIDIVALGEPMIELNQQPDGRYLQDFGGDTSNAAIVAARLGAKVRYLTLLGEDWMGDALISLWQREGVDAHCVRRHPTAPTGVYFVTHGSKGHAFTYLRAGSAASRMTPADVPKAALSGARFLHVSAIGQAISATARETVSHAIAIAREEGAQLSYDTNLRLRLWPLEEARPVVAETARGAQLLKTSIEDAHALTGLESEDAVADHYLGEGASVVVVTLGSKGLLAATTSRRERFAPHRVNAVDATGAGDACAGAMLACLCRGSDPFEAARFANAAAALATTDYGAIKPVIRRADVERLLTA